MGEMHKAESRTLAGAKTKCGIEVHRSCLAKADSKVTCPACLAAMKGEGDASSD